MRNTIIILLTGLLFTSCGTYNSSKKSVTEAHTKSDKMLDGKWTLKSYSAYMDVSGGMPVYNDGDVVWEISGNSVVITKKNPNEKNDLSIPAGDYTLWKKKCILAISDETMSPIHETYMFTIEDDGYLVLNSDIGTDPRYSTPDAPVLYFKRMK